MMPVHPLTALPDGVETPVGPIILVIRLTAGVIG